jgi:hypothetical protein
MTPPWVQGVAKVNNNWILQEENLDFFHCLKRGRCENGRMVDIVDVVVQCLAGSSRWRGHNRSSYAAKHSRCGGHNRISCAARNSWCSRAMPDRRGRWRGCNRCGEPLSAKSARWRACSTEQSSRSLFQYNNLCIRWNRSGDLRRKYVVASPKTTTVRDEDDPLTSS